jgi:hypothetical protein
MHILKALVLSLPLSMIALTQANDASACGGCMLQQTESTQVTGHKMILSISKTQTTLWDQITYDGNPSSFAWILPIHGTVDVGLSSDALFQLLEQETQVTVAAPPSPCPSPPSCGYGDGAYGGAILATATGGAPEVEVLAQEVVGPYETVQLSSTTANALKDWLAMHNFNIPADIAPVIDTYLAEGFNFLALRLVPDQSVSAIQPVRVTTVGSSPVLPLRMVAAGTGAVTPITLWVMSEGRYETSNRPTFTVNEPDLIWDWNSQSSNYAALRQAGFDNSMGNAWQVEAAEPTSPYNITNALNNLVQYNPQASGYADSMGQGAKQALDADLAALIGGINESAFWISRLHGELSREALKTDLELGASATQTPLNRFLQTTRTTGTPPACPTYQPCSNGDWGFWGNTRQDGTNSSACAMTEKDSSPALLSGLALAAALSVARARRRRAR